MRKSISEWNFAITIVTTRGSELVLIPKLGSILPENK